MATGEVTGDSKGTPTSWEYGRTDPNPRIGTCTGKTPGHPRR
jgi:hypothetical protein